MSLFGLKEKKELERLKSQLSPEQIRLSDLQGQLLDVEENLQKKQRELDAAIKQLEQAKIDLVETNETVLLQSFGLYTPHYSFMTSDEYKQRLLDIRNEQKQQIKNDTAVIGAINWTVDGSQRKGAKMLADMKKLLLRAFNSECDDVVEHVKFNNIESSEKRIEKSKDAISKLGQMMKISISPSYYKLKIEELYLAFEYQEKKQEEKEALKEQRARLREEAKIAKELEEARKSLEKEKSHYTNALQKLIVQMEQSGESEDTLHKKEQLELKLQEIQKSIQDVDYREANKRAGYVYIISNVGAFGENVYKIGMTRRLDPTERVDELGDASVPFNFDIHAMIFSDDAPKLEAALHNAFAAKKLNFVNQRREFFHVTLDEIKNVVKENYDKTVEFIDIAPAEQYRQSLLIQNENLQDQ